MASDPDEVPITIAFPKGMAELIAVLDDDPATRTHPLSERVAAVLARFAYHAKKGVQDPLSWESTWLGVAFGGRWQDLLEPDPEHPVRHWRRPKG